MSLLKFGLTLLVTGLVTLASARPDSNGVLYVNNSVTGGDGGGSSWENAIPELADALEQARTLNTALPETVTQIWVAQGTYMPSGIAANASVFMDALSTRDYTFVMQKDVSLYGSFIGNETTTAARTLPPESTRLSGDIGIPEIDSDNCYHVMVVLRESGDITIDGFSIQDGNANHVPFYDPFTFQSSANVTMNSTNIMRTACGGATVEVSNVDFNNVIFTGNFSRDSGGALHIAGSTSNISNVRINNNRTVGAGAAMGDWRSTVTLTNASITGNHAGIRGAAIHNDGSDLTLTNATVSGNMVTNADVGAGIWAISSGSIIRLRNTIVSGNYRNGLVSEIAAEFGGTIESSSSLVGSEFINSTGTTSTVAAQPANLFTQIEPAASAPTAAGDYTLQADSFAIDQGADTWFQAGQTPDLANITTDLQGESRKIGSSIDLGAYEYNPTATVHGWDHYEVNQ